MSLELDEFIEKFKQKYDLRENIIESSDKFIHTRFRPNVKSYVEFHSPYFAHGLMVDPKMELELYESIANYYKANFDYDVYKAFKNFPSEEEYTAALRIKHDIFFKVPQWFEKFIECHKTRCPENVDPEVHENGVANIAVKYYPENYPTKNIAKLKIFDKSDQPISDEYPYTGNIAKLTKMTSGSIDLQYGYRCLFCKATWEPTKEIDKNFTRNDSLIEELNLDYIDEIYEYNENSNILLVKGAGVGGFITTVEMLTEDTHIKT